MNNEKLSIIICTHRRFDLLKLAVESLCNQNVSGSEFCVIVVDNDIFSNAEVRKIVDEAKQKIQISYIHESILGLSQARNTGGKTAATEYIGYIDDDAKVPVNYVETALKIIENIKPDIFGGPHYAFYLSRKPKWFKNEYGSSSNNNTRFMGSNEFISGMNMFFYKPILDLVNWFDPELGMIGNKIWYAEETLVQINARKKNSELKVYFDQNLYVYHLVSENKMLLSDCIKRSYNLGKSQAYMWIENNKISLIKKKSFVPFCKSLINILIKEPIKIIFRNKSKFQYWQNYVYECYAKNISVYAANKKFFTDYLKGN